MIKQFNELLEEEIKIIKKFIIKYGKIRENIEKKYIKTMGRKIHKL
jgi:hypothetical protein